LKWDNTTVSVIQDDPALRQHFPQSWLHAAPRIKEGDSWQMLKLSQRGNSIQRRFGEE